jgi:hypothetical protein
MHPANEKIAAMETSAAMAFFRFMGISGWLVLFLMLVSGIAFNPSQYGGHDILWLQWALAVAIWLCARWGTFLKEKVRKS